VRAGRWTRAEAAAARDQLAALPAGHAYRRFVDGRLPHGIQRDQAWRQAVDPLLVVLAADLCRPGARSGATTERSTDLAHYMYTQARRDPEVLADLSRLLHNVHLRKFTALEMTQRRHTPGSLRVGLAHLQSYQRAFSDLFPRPASKPSSNKAAFSPVPREHVAIALAEADRLTAEARGYARATVLLPYTTGADGIDLDGFLRSDLQVRNGKALWAEFHQPGRRRSVPVADFQTEVLELRARTDREELTRYPNLEALRRLNKSLARHRHDFQLDVKQLRRTWMLHRLLAGVPLPALMQAAALTTLDALEPLLPFLPALPDDDVAIAEMLCRQPAGLPEEAL
jgi:hypothetical protein